MKRRILALLLACTMVSAVLTGCGNAPASEEPAQSVPAVQEAEASAASPEESAPAQSAPDAAAQSASAAEESAAASSAPETEAPAEAVSGNAEYAWLGLQDMPRCPYLDVLCTYHYYRVYTNYVLSFKQEQIEAVDGVNSYKKTDSNRVYSVDGRVISFSDSAKKYMEQDISGGLYNQAKDNLETSRADGVNMIGRQFVTTGTGVIPVYSDTEGDQTEYEYYEYEYPATLEATGYQMVERFYMKDGDVYAIYQQMSKDDKQASATTEVIESMSGEIPEGTFDIPSTDGYEKM